MNAIELTRNSRTGGHNLESVAADLEGRGVSHTLAYNARPEGYGVADVLTVNPEGQEWLLDPEEWRLLGKGYGPPPLPVKTIYAQADGIPL